MTRILLFDLAGLHLDQHLPRGVLQQEVDRPLQPKDVRLELELRRDVVQFGVRDARLARELPVAPLPVPRLDGLKEALDPADKRVARHAEARQLLGVRAELLRRKRHEALARERLLREQRKVLDDVVDDRPRDRRLAGVRGVDQVADNRLAQAEGVDHGGRVDEDVGALDKHRRAPVREDDVLGKRREGGVEVDDVDDLVDLELQPGPRVGEVQRVRRSRANLLDVVDVLHVVWRLPVRDNTPDKVLEVGVHPLCCWRMKNGQSLQMIARFPTIDTVQGQRTNKNKQILPFIYHQNKPNPETQ